MLWLGSGGYHVTTFVISKRIDMLWLKMGSKCWVVEVLANWLVWEWTFSSYDSKWTDTVQPKLGWKGGSEWRLVDDRNSRRSNMEWKGTPHPCQLDKVWRSIILLGNAVPLWSFWSLVPLSAVSVWILSSYHNF